MWLVGWVTGEIVLKAKRKQTRAGVEACTDPRIIKKSELCPIDGVIQLLFIPAKISLAIVNHYFH